MKESRRNFIVKYFSEIRHFAKLQQKNRTSYFLASPNRNYCRKGDDGMDNAALFKVGYGLYVLTVRDDEKDNGCIVNTVMQVTSGPLLLGVVAVSKQNHTHDMVMRTRKFNVSVLTTNTPFEVFQRFGFQSGATVNKFAGYDGTRRSENGVLYLTKDTNAFLSFEVTDTIDFDTHTMFKADIISGEVMSEADSVTYAHYQRFIQPKPQMVMNHGYRCNICGYVFEGEVLPEDFICPICKHGASDFTYFSNFR